MQQRQPTQQSPPLSTRNNQYRTSITSVSSIPGNGQLGKDTALSFLAGTRLNETGNLLRYTPFPRGVSPTALLPCASPRSRPLTGASPSPNCNLRVNRLGQTDYHGRSVAARQNTHLPGGQTAPPLRPPAAAAPSRAVEVFQASRNSGYLARRRQMIRQAARGASRTASMMAASSSTPSLSSSWSNRRLSQGPLVAAVAEGAPTAAAAAARGGRRPRAQSAREKRKA
jgi:hypothetical protein